MALIRFALYLALFVLLAPQPVVAGCQGAGMLAAIRDAYWATLHGPVADRPNAARALLVLVGGGAEAAAAQRLSQYGISLDQARLAAVLGEAKSLALTTTTEALPDRAAFEHSQNIAWLSGALDVTGCNIGAARARPGAKPDLTSPPVLQPTNNSTATTDTKQDWAPIILAVVLMAVPYGGYRALRSTFLRRYKADRMPRFPIALALNLTFVDETGQTLEKQVEAQDISQGGLKVKWDQAPPTGTPVSVSLLNAHRPAQVMWANTYFAGILLDDPLTEPELNQLRSAQTKLQKTKRRPLGRRSDQL